MSSLLTTYLLAAATKADIGLWFIILVVLSLFIIAEETVIQDCAMMRQTWPPWNDQQCDDAAIQYACEFNPAKHTQMCYLDPKGILICDTYQTLCL